MCHTCHIRWSLANTFTHPFGSLVGHVFAPVEPKPPRVDMFNPPGQAERCKWGDDLGSLCRVMAGLSPVLHQVDRGFGRTVPRHSIDDDAPLVDRDELLPLLR